MLKNQSVQKRFKKCPFCGEPPIVIEDKTSEGAIYQLRCNNTECWVCPYTSFYSDKKTAIKAWNTRISFVKKLFGGWK